MPVVKQIAYKSPIMAKDIKEGFAFKKRVTKLNKARFSVFDIITALVVFKVIEFLVNHLHISISWS